MHSKLSVTFPANAAAKGPTSSGMRIEKHLSAIIIYKTSLREDVGRSLRLIDCLAIESPGVTNCTRTFLCSRQVDKPTVVACNTFVSVYELCEKRRHF